jgi:hypothetical protein
LVFQVTRSDINETANTLLRHEKLVFSGLMCDLINTVKQRAAFRLEGARLSHTELLNTPEFIFEECSHQTGRLLAGNSNGIILDLGSGQVGH